MVRENTNWEELKEKLGRLSSRAGKVISPRGLVTNDRAMRLAGVFGAPVPSRYKGAYKPPTSESKGDGGRGRPKGSYAYSIPTPQGPKAVPISVYKKWISQQKSQIRLQNELRQARLSAQVAPDHVRGYGSGAEDAWLAAEEFNPQQMQGQMPQEIQAQQGPGAFERFKAMLARRRMGGGYGGGQDYGQGYGQQPYSGGFGPNIQGQVVKPPMSAGPNGTPRLSIWGGPSSILHSGNIFNNPGRTQVRP